MNNKDQVVIGLNNFLLNSIKLINLSSRSGFLILSPLFNVLLVSFESSRFKYFSSFFTQSLIVVYGTPNFIGALLILVSLAYFTIFIWN